MASLITLSSNFIFSSPSPSTHTSHLNPRTQQQQQQHPFYLVLFKDSVSKKFASLGISCLFQMSSCSGFGSGSGSATRRRRICSTCKVWESEGDPDLEAEVLEFMKNSKNPNLFPTKEELIEAGKIDLLKSIVKQGGWLSLGWDLDDGEEAVQQGRVPISDSANGVSDAFLTNDSRIFQDRFLEGGTGLKGFQAGDSFSPTSSSYSPSSSGRVEGKEEAGIEGILTRLEKERTQSYGFDSKDKESEVYGSWNDSKEDLKMKIPDVLESDSIQCNCDEPRNSLKPDMWRKWSNKRAGISKDEFEAAEFGEVVNRNDEMVTNACSGYKEKETVKDYNWIRSRLQHMESELDSALQLVRCNSDSTVSDKGSKISSQESLSLSDAWEFRETEITKARDKLRSLRAQFTILEGQMALKIIETQKMIEMKQKKIHAAEKALNSLRTACVVWHKPAGEVLLVGSFDGWTNQRRMQLSSPGIFSLNLKLYPGRYEIKFIVDGMWMIDPLRPIVNSDGHQNNLLIIS